MGFGAVKANRGLGNLRIMFPMVASVGELDEALALLEQARVELAEEGMTMLCVTHEMGFARRVAHRVIFMDQGHIIEDRPTEEFFTDSHSERAQRFLAKILHH